MDDKLSQVEDYLTAAGDSMTYTEIARSLQRVSLINQQLVNLLGISSPKTRTRSQSQDDVSSAPVLADEIMVSLDKMSLDDSTMISSSGSESHPRLNIISSESNSISLESNSISLKSNSASRDDYIGTHDKFFSVTMSIPTYLGDISYLHERLQTNFRKLFPPCYPVRAWAYAISNDKNPTLIGLIRYITDSAYNISRKSTHVIKAPYLRPQGGGGLVNHPMEIKQLTVFSNKRRLTLRNDIVDAYRTMIGNIVGSNLRDFLQES
jgi:hypothetical protein